MPSNYEHLELQDVGSRSVYSGLNPYVNTRGEVDLSTGKQHNVFCLREWLGKACQQTEHTLKDQITAHKHMAAFYTIKIICNFAEKLDTPETTTLKLTALS